MNEDREKGFEMQPERSTQVRNEITRRRGGLVLCMQEALGSIPRFVRPFGNGLGNGNGRDHGWHTVGIALCLLFHINKY